MTNIKLTNKQANEVITQFKMAALRTEFAVGRV